MNYRGEIKFRFKYTYKPMSLFQKKLFGFVRNITRSLVTYKEYNVGDKVGQLIIIPYPEINFTEAKELSETDRNDNGFGSTDDPKTDKPLKSTRNSRSRKKK